MESVIGGALLAGLVGSPHCVGMCGAFAVAASERPLEGLAWHAGRLTTYAVLGALAGAAGSALPGPPWVGPALAGVFLVYFAARLAGLPGLPESWTLPLVTRVGTALVRRRGIPGRYAFGLANGLLPCGLVYAALALPVAAGGALPGALAMLAFGAGTVPILAVAGAGLRRLAARSLAARRLLAVAVLAAGLLTVGKATAKQAGWIHPSHNGHGGGPAAPAAAP